MNFFYLLENRHLEFLTGSFITSVTKQECGLMVYSNVLSEPAWNYTTQLPHDPDHLPDLVESIIVCHHKNNRRPCICVHDKNTVFLNYLKDQGFQVLFRDAWMIYNETTARNSKNSHPLITIKELNTHLIKEDFVRVFLDGYSKKSINDLYDFNCNNSIIIEQLMLENGYVKKGVVAYIEEVPIACGLIAMDKSVAGIYCIGVIHHARNQGIGERIVNTLTQFALSKGIKSIFLQTESGSHLEKWYQKLGFKTNFTTYYLVK